MNTTPLEKHIAYVFKQKNLLKQALTHRSYGTPNNERLEFLGDSVVNCVTAQLLYIRFPVPTEGVLSRLRANLVCQQSLFEIAEQIHLGQYLMMGDGEFKTGGRQRPSTLADALESLFGAILLDGGFDQVNQVITRLYAEKIAAINPDIPDKDAKTLLQEYLQSHHLPLPDYTLVQTSGQAHEQIFYIDCIIPALSLRTHGQAANRRAAEQAAAAIAWQAISLQRPIKAPKPRSNTT